MSDAIIFSKNKASETQIANHLTLCDNEFVPPLSVRVRIDNYARKLHQRATKFEAWQGETLIGLIAAYCNDREKGIAFISSVSVLKNWTKKGIATRLLQECIAYARSLKMRQISLEVARDNAMVFNFYTKNGFVIDHEKAEWLNMTFNITNRN
ncbi:hypothetical protein AGMMS50256_19520 [Betaproteobacteria bacterium]|nr:hypothetical protein AGMMS50256_19520 [Betaproteobacteria bacterium]